jgi:DNA-binding NarL/FixJ family response regulator
MKTLRIMLADDHAVVREGLRALINAQPGMEVVGEAADGVAAVEAVAALDPDVVVLDVSLPGLNGAQVAKRLRAASPNRVILALTVHEDAAYFRLLVDAGVAGYVLKRSAADELIRAIRVVAAGGTYFDTALTGWRADAGGDPESRPPVLPELSEREVEVMKLIAQGYSNKEIAARLVLSVKTVETYKTRSLEKLGLRSRVDIVRYAARQGWLLNIGEGHG